MNVKLHIERLVLDGFPLSAAQGAAVKTALETELSHLMSQHGISPDLQQRQFLPRVRPALFQPAREASPRALGKQIARSLYGGIGKAR
jgi:hypothetical protein